MIARLAPKAPPQASYLGFLEALKAAGFAGEIAPDYANRTVLATDNSLYQRLPQAVLYPRHAEDLVRIARLAGQEEHRGVVLTPRGGGTGTNGQSLTDGLVVDVSRHMNAILEIDVEHRRVRVQAGVVKDQLNAALKPHGLFFAPELSTSNRATIGGMIATDASGQGSCTYGKTRDHVLELDSVLLGGERLTTRPVDEAELEVLCARDDVTGRAYRTAREIIDTQDERIKATFPSLNRCLTGYDLAHLRTAEGKFDLNSLLCGAEGSLAFTCEAVLNVLPIPRHSTLVNVRYSGFMDALRDARALMGGGSASQQQPQAGPTSIETVDDTVLDLAMQDFVWDSVAEFFHDSGGTPTHGINLVEFNDDDPARLARRVEAFCRHLEQDASVPRLGYTLAEGRAAIQKVYAMRKRAVGLLGNAQGERRPLPFVEDTAVPPEHLADFIAEFRALLDARGLDYGMFGHVDAGVLHVRPALDMKDPADERLVREISDAVAALTRKYDGLLWGEHGKGVRSEYAPAFFGALYPSLQRVKAAFDPYNQLNPGKIATPLSSPPEAADRAIPPDDAEPSIPPEAADRTTSPNDAEPLSTPNSAEPSASADSDTDEQAMKWVDPGLLAIDGVPTRGQYDRSIDPRVWQAHAATVYCNGNGACYNYDPDDAMCPSWKATRDRVHSPKGRASLVREWLRLQGAAGVDLIEEARRRRREGVWGGIRRLPARAWNTLCRRREADFSHEVYDAMAGCLACKSCAGQCPIKVNVPDSRAQFLEVYHGRYLRPLRDHLVGSLEFLLPALSRIAPLYNAALGNRLVERLLAGSVGMVDSPRLSRSRLQRRLDAWGVDEATPASLGRLTADDRARSVVLVQDAFTRHFEARLVLDVVELLTRLGVRVFVAPYAANGKPLHVQGFLGAFERTAAKQAKRLRALAEFGVPLVGIDPAMTLTYRQEYVKALGPEAVPEVRLLQEWLATHADRLANRLADGPALADPGFRLLAHCTEATTAPGSPGAWQRVFAAFGLKLELVSTGCCGMSGTYGHETRNLATSRTLYAQSWQPLVEDPANAGRLLASGYSCRSQTRRFSDAALPHPLQGLLAVLKRSDRRPLPAATAPVDSRTHSPDPQLERQIP
ncbi:MULTISPECIES: FAD-binding and (Fe-S)-binding domain-containing protein [unclassified Halomonas]|uniref:FAD-binding and (Fe-S)-binding domain-containing protein n=1 Tax=unclassified Halomonas TaxID=2609666 RepID=UPI002887491F|nr:MULTISPECIES: FAD-binding and (Fe-S)-binding domain-containing protein [unclassified Halomonas]MDT0512453.1 FAD-binding and (Fe-S)-binding domain-containing protein [Halomonas sp. LES1]MDT0591087.1 FAD-binding and (Fe-S)-binding domain-containing protein [Halomonas sp. PAR8]